MILPELQSIASSLASSAAAFAMGFASKWLLDKWRNRKFHAIWNHFRDKDSDISVILSTRPGPVASSTPRVSLKELAAFVEMDSLFRKLGHATTAVSSDEGLSLLGTCNIVLLGGAKANQVTSAIWAEVVKRTALDIDLEAHKIVTEKTVYEPKLDDTGKLYEDYGILVKMRQPSNPQKWLLLSAGCHGYSTCAGIGVATNGASAHALGKLVAGGEFVAVVRVRLKNGVEISRDVVECKKLDKLPVLSAMQAR